ncbi:MAG: aminotransferase class IV [Rhodospirillales bacterium]|nr:aminotransferase class IV [Rhodospirillales bacterium]
MTQDTIEFFSASDRITLGHGVFDTLRIENGIPVHGSAHMDRLIRHACAFGIDTKITCEDLLGRIMNRITQAHATHGCWRLRTVLSAGEGPPGLALPSAPRPTLCMTLAPAPGPQTLAPLNLVVAQTTRRNELSPLSHIKSTNYGDNILATIEARARGATDAILLNTRGRVACASTGNVFALLPDGTLATPPCTEGAMDGIIRGILLAQGATERPLTPDDLAHATGVFVTNSLVGIRPAAHLEEKKFSTLLDISTRFDLS